METLSSGEGSSFGRDSAIPPQGAGPPAANNSPQNTKNFNWLKRRYRGEWQLTLSFNLPHGCQASAKEHVSIAGRLTPS